MLEKSCEVSYKCKQFLFAFLQNHFKSERKFHKNLSGRLRQTKSKKKKNKVKCEYFWQLANCIQNKSTKLGFLKVKNVQIFSHHEFFFRKKLNAIEIES